jgi:hypothetical protein
MGVQIALHQGPGCSNLQQEGKGTGGRTWKVLVAGEGPDEDGEKDGAARPQSPVPPPSPGNEEGRARPHKRKRG